MMTRRRLIIFSLLFLVLQSSAQKIIIDNDSYKTWTALQEIRPNVSSLISNDGKYVVYKYGSPASGDFLVTQSIDGTYKKEFPIQYGEFTLTEDSRRQIFLTPGDSLAVLALGKQDITFIKSVKSFKTPQKGNGRWLAYQLNNIQDEVVLKDLFTGQEKKYTQVEQYQFNVDGDILVVKTSNTIIWKDLLHNNDKQIMNGSNASFLVLDQSFKQLAFLIKRNNTTEICYFKDGMDSAVAIINSKSEGVPQGLIIDFAPLSFTPDGGKLFFQLKEEIETGNISNKDTSIFDNVEIWNYKDKFLMPGQSSKHNTFLAVSNINTPKVIQLTTPEIGAIDLGSTDCSRSNNILAWDITGQELHKSKDSFSVYLISLRDGSKRIVKKFVGSNLIAPFLSPSEEFVIWFDNSDKQYYSYEITTGITRNISASIPVPLYDDESDIIAHRTEFGIAGWLPNDNALLVYDRYDIWLLDPHGTKAPVNITNGFGRKNSLIFRRVDKEGEELPVIQNDTILLTALNALNKDNGFWTLNISTRSKLDKCTMGKYVYCFPQPSPNIRIALSRDFPQKAKHANVYIVRRMSGKESPNLFLTHDFKSYAPLTDIHPEKLYNWMDMELVRWKLPNGKNAEGILYKPEDFDPAKKYPVIFYYYEKLSDGLNMYKTPGLSDGVLSIPWYVSHGYLVFVPNIYYETGHVARSIVGTITSAVEHLSGIPWIDTKKMGLQGHSFGGFETITLITHTNLFVAAQESAGTVNSISYYNHRIGTGNRNYYFDVEQGNMGCSPWEQPGRYIENSPIFHVQNIHTPLLIMHNEGDGNVLFSQAVELFTSLRRLGKKAWMLQYNRKGEPPEGHMILDTPNQLDFTIRQQQFFEFYLKGAAAPLWMTTNGYKGLLLDSSGVK